MSKQTIKTKLGAELVIRPADFDDAMHLQSVLMTEMAKADMGLEIDLKDVSSIIPLILSVGGNKDIHTAVFACLKQCTYNGVGVKKELFDDFEIRGDYYEVLMECAKFNCSVFFVNLLSGLSSILPTQQEDQK